MSAGAELAEEVTGPRNWPGVRFRVRAVNSAAGARPADKRRIASAAASAHAFLAVEADENGQAELRWQPPEDYGAR